MRYVVVIFALALLALARVASAQNYSYWLDDRADPTQAHYRTWQEACIVGEFEREISRLRAAETDPSVQFRIDGYAMTVQLDLQEAFCQANIEKRYHLGWLPVESLGPISVFEFGGSCTSALTGYTDPDNGQCAPPKCNGQCCDATGPGGCTNNGSDPIQTASGNLHEEQTDFVGTGPFPLRFTRVYNSDRIPDFAPAPLGAAWTHSYASHIIGYPSAGSPPVDTASVYRGDGRVLKFTLTGGIWQPDPDVTERLSASMDGSAVIGWTLTTADDEVEQYDGEGRLRSITNRGGFLQTLSYTGTDGHPKDSVQQVSDPQGHALTFGYNTSTGQITSITDGNGAAIQYGYTTDGNNNLQTVVYPDLTGTKTRTYYYAGAGPYGAGTTQTGGVSQPNALTGIQDENGQSFASWGYDSQGRAILSVHGPYATGTIDHTSFVFNADGTVSITDGLSQTRKFTFQNPVQYLVARYVALDTACDYCGTNFTSRGYDANGYPSTGTDFRSFQTTSQYLANDSNSHPRGLETQLDEAVGQAEERITNTTWDANYRVPDTRTVKNHSGTIETRTDWVYNTRGQPTARCEYDLTVAGASSYVCSATGTPPAGIRRWVYTYCDAINLAAPDPISSSGENLGKGCPLVGLIRRVDGPRIDVNDWTTYQYYLTSDTGTPPKFRAGDLNETIDALGHITQYLAYDGNGRTTQMQDANSIASSFSYHPRGWLHIRTVCANTNCSPSANDAPTQTDYDGVGNVVKVTQPDGVYLSYTFDNAHRLTNITDKLGDHIDYTLDALGHRIAEKTFDVSDAVNPRRLLTRAYSTLSRMTDTYDAQVRDTKFSYDGNGNRTDQTDPLGVKSHWDFDGINRLKDQIGDYQGTDASTANSETSYAYDTRDNITSVTDPDGQPPGTVPATSYTFDGLNDLKLLQSPDTGTTMYGTSTQPGYDAAGNRLMQTDNRGIVWTMAYDALNRLTGTTYPTTSLNVAYRYDSYLSNPCAATSYPVGRLTGMTDASGSTQYCYDLRGNITEKIQVAHGYRFDTRYSYNLADRLMSVTYPSGAVASYTRDADGRIQTVSVTPPGGTVTSILTSLTWQPFGPSITYTFAQGSQTLTKMFDQNYWMTDVTGSALTLHFCRDAQSNITSIAAASPACSNTPTEQYKYDNLYRLIHVQDGTGSNLQDFTYNLTGDRQTKTLDPSPTQTYTYTPNTHRLDGVGANARMLDPNGNTKETTGSATLDFTFDDRNRMTAISRNSTPITSYDYNAKGERVYKTTTYPASDTRWFDFAESGMLLGEYTATAAQEYVWADGTPVAILAIAGAAPAPADQIFANGFEAPPVTTVDYVHTDQLDSPRIVTSTTGASQWNWPWQTNPFGETAPTGTLALNLRFPGQYLDAETGLNYNYFRDYEPGTGRYVESDPIGLGAGLGTYTYVFNAALRWKDNNGLSTGGSSSACCAQAKQQGDFRSPTGQGDDWGIVECCNGQKTACSNVDPNQVNSEVAFAIASACVKKHEEHHFPEVTCPTCGIKRPGRNPDVNPKTSECSARSVEIDCLNDGGKACGNDPVCHSQVNALRDARQRENSKCGSYR
ncbi:MAG: RHS repeat protein [Proteobacteria bacterium]|nr:RHS repeat protein [Pseudomonadota bacterium]